MARSLDEVQQNILDALDEVMNEPVIEQAIPDSKTLPVDPVTKKLKPYVAVQFFLRQGRRYNMATPLGDDYYLHVYTQCVAPTAKVARIMSNRMHMGLIGLSFPWSGTVRLISSGPGITASTSATEAYVQPASHSVLIQLSNDA